MRQQTDDQDFTDKQEMKMQPRLTEKPVNEVIAAIQALDLESVTVTVMDKERGEGWSRQRAEAVARSYKAFLGVLAKYRNEMPDIALSTDVDAFWHTHILQTRKYACDCDAIFGTFLHHNPHVGARGRDDVDKKVAQLERTRQLYLREYGDAHAANQAWGGTLVNAALDTRRAAYCDVAAERRHLAYCDASVAAKAAYCDASVATNVTAYCDASLGRNDAAYCDVAIETASTAYCDASSKALPTAYCDVSVEEKVAAYCDASIAQNGAAYCDATILVETVGNRDAAIEPNVAYCDASVRL